MSDAIDLIDVKAGDRFWECAEGKNTELEAMADAFQSGDLVQCQARAVATNEPVALRLDVTAPWFGPRLYRRPQYVQSPGAPLEYPQRTEGLRLVRPHIQIVETAERESARLLDEYGSGLRDGLLVFQIRTLKEDIARMLRRRDEHVRTLEHENRTLRAALAVLAQEREGRIVIAQRHLDEAADIEITTEASDEAHELGRDVAFQLKVVGDA